MERRHRERSVAAWKREHSILERRIDAAIHFDGYPDHSAAGLTFGLRRGEHVFMVVDRVELVEPGVDGIMTAPVLDTGIATITDCRVVFEGSRLRNREWAFARLTDAVHHNRPPATSMQVENRKKASAIVYDAECAADVRFILDLALAHFAGQVAAFRADLESELAHHEQHRPGVHAGEWVWRGWARPVPTALSIAALLLSGAVVYATSGGDNARNVRRAATPPTTLAAPPSHAAPAPPSTSIPAPSPVVAVSTAPATRRAARPNTTPPSNAPAPARTPTCATAAAIGPLAVPDPVCTVGSL
jgi:hypothetical protein